MKPSIGPTRGFKFARRAVACLALPIALAALTAGSGSASAADGIVIKDFVLTHAIDEREPIDMVEGFTPADERGYAFVRVHNEGPPASLTAVWLHEGNIHARVGLNVGTSSGWRTWSSANLKPGDWVVQLRDTQGVILAERAFAVESEFAMDEGAYDGTDGGMKPAGATFDDAPVQQVEEWPEFDPAGERHQDDIDG